MIQMKSNRLTDSQVWVKPCALGPADIWHFAGEVVEEAAMNAAWSRSFVAASNKGIATSNEGHYY